MSLVIIGSIGLDDISTPEGSVTKALGGSAIYASLAAVHFCDTHIVGVVGTDFPVQYVELLKEHHVNLDGMETREGKTFRWSGKYDNFNRAETIFTELNVLAEFSPVIPYTCKTCTSLLLANIHPSLHLQVLSQIESYTHVACDTMNYWIGLCPQELEMVIRRVDIVFMNEDEIRDYTGEGNIFTAARAVLDLGPKWVIVKRGEYGAVAVSPETMFFVPAYPVEKVVDPTGAGDTFAGAMMGFLANHPDLNVQRIKQAIRYATVIAAMDVQNFSIFGMVNRSFAEIQNKKEHLEQWTT